MGQQQARRATIHADELQRVARVEPAAAAEDLDRLVIALGPYIGAAVPILITLAIQGLVPGLAVLGYAVLYQQVEYSVLSPRASAGTMSLDGGVAFGAALAGGAIAGRSARSWRCRSRR